MLCINKRLYRAGSDSRNTRSTSSRLCRQSGSARIPSNFRRPSASPLRHASVISRSSCLAADIPSCKTRNCAILNTPFHVVPAQSYQDFPLPSILHRSRISSPSLIIIQSNVLAVVQQCPGRISTWLPVELQVPIPFR